jgi:pimeloyl-ACP methyl ester carboxylesterase
VLPEHYQDVVAAFHYMRSRPELCPGGRAGIGGLSFAMGPGLKAALEPSIRDQVRFLFCIGGYHGIRETLGYVTTGDYREAGGPWRQLPPDSYGRWVLASCLLDHVQHEPSRQALRAMVDRKIPEPLALVEELVPQLEDPDAVALYELVTNSDRDQVERLFQRLPARMRDALMAMDLAGLDLADLQARLILVHGYEDSLIPFTQSLDLYRRAGSGHKLYLVNGLGHVTMKKTGLLDKWALLSSVTALLRELER